MATVRTLFDEELRELQQQLLLMGTLVDSAIEKAVDCLKRLDETGAREVMANDVVINQKRLEIEDRVVQIMATQQPMASDLRLLIAVLRIVVDLERMGDHAEGIGKIVLLHGQQPLVKPLIDIPRMSIKAREMLHGALEAFSRRDVDASLRIAMDDDEVDALHDQIFHELLVYMLRDPSTIERASYLMWASHNLERIADRATNICEQTIYLVTGKMEEINISKY
ncbi:MAG: phosphate signaling complex protein PhoU [Dehalococcoidia bacterium]|nr:phosphate signaling complex protein PhoU [Dehalococcoidia bacterium]